ncbi:MAG: tetratricopeptide repeat protein [Candidatus Paceibacterota bacterium]
MDNVYDYTDSGQFREPSGSEGDARTNESKGAIKVAHTLFIAALLFLPFIFVPIPGWSVSVGKVVITALLALSGGVTLFSSLFSGSNIVLPRTYSALLGGMLLMLILSLVFSSSFAASFFGAALEVGTFFTTAVAIVLALIAPLILTSKKRLVSALGALFAGAAILGIFHLLRLFLGPEALSFGYFTVPASTPAGSWNDLGIFFGVIYLISLVSLVFGSLPSRVRVVLAIVLALSLALVFLVNFQLLSGLLALTTLGLLVVSFILKRGGSILPGIYSLVFLVMLALFSAPLGNLTGNLFNTSYAEIRPNWSSTGDMLGAGLSNVKNIVLGSGPNTFTYLWQQERSPLVTESDFWSIDFAFSSGIIPTFAITLGLITVAVMIAFALYLGLLVYRTIRMRGADPLLFALSLASGIAALFLWILGTVYVFSVMIFLLMFILSGIAAAAFTQMGSANTIALSGRGQTGMVVGIIGATLCILLLVPAVLISASRTIYGQGVVEANLAENIEEVAQAQQKIRTASILERNAAFARTDTEFGMLRIQEFLSREDVDESDQEPFSLLVRETQAAAERAGSINPADYFNWVNLGLVYETLGLLEIDKGFEFAAESYAQARALNPTNPELILIQARLERARGNEEAAIAFGEEALALKPNYADANLLLADIDLVNENVAGAITRIEEAMEVSPQNSFLPYQLGLIHYSEADYDRAIESFSTAISRDPNYANARYFRALSYVYGENDTEKALQDLRRITEENAENEVLLAVIANIEAGNDPLEGIAEDDPALPPAEDEATPGTNAEAISELETESNPDNQTQSTTPPAPAPETEVEPGA